MKKGEIRSFTFAPDSRSVLFVRSKNDSSRLARLDLNSGSANPITGLLPCTASSPTHSADGARVAFDCETKATGLSRILIMKADGSDIHPLFSSNSNNCDFAPHFAPDGTEIYFGRQLFFRKDEGRGGEPVRPWDLYSASLDGKNERRLTDRHFEDFEVSYASGGRTFVLTRDVGSGTRLNLYSLDDPTKGLTPIRVLFAKGTSLSVVTDAGLSSDARSVYFMAAGGDETTFDYDVCRQELAGGTAEKLTTANGYATAMSVSADGKTAVFLKWTSQWGSLPNLSRLYLFVMATKQLTP